MNYRPSISIEFFKAFQSQVRGLYHESQTDTDNNDNNSCCVRNETQLLISDMLLKLNQLGDKEQAGKPADKTRRLIKWHNFTELKG